MADFVVPVVGGVSALLTAGALQYSFGDNFKTKEKPTEEKGPGSMPLLTPEKKLSILDSSSSEGFKKWLNSRYLSSVSGGLWSREDKPKFTGYQDPNHDDVKPAWKYFDHSIKNFKAESAKFEEVATHRAHFDTLIEWCGTLDDKWWNPSDCKAFISSKFNMETNVFVPAIPEEPVLALPGTGNATIASPTGSANIPSMNSPTMSFAALLAYLLAFIFVIRFDGRMARKRKAKRQQPKTDSPDAKTQEPASKSPKTRGQQEIHTLTTFTDCVKAKYQNSCDYIETLLRESRLKRSSDEKCCDRLVAAQSKMEKLTEDMIAKNEKLKLLRAEAINAYTKAQQLRDELATKDEMCRQSKEQASIGYRRIIDLRNEVAAKDEELKLVKVEALAANEKAAKLNETMMQIAKRLKAVDSRTKAHGMGNPVLSSRTSTSSAPTHAPSKTETPLAEHLPAREFLSNKITAQSPPLKVKFASSSAEEDALKPIKKAFPPIHQSMIEMARKFKSVEVKDNETKEHTLIGPSNSPAGSNPQTPASIDLALLRWQGKYILAEQARITDAEEAVEQEWKKVIEQKTSEAWKKSQESSKTHKYIPLPAHPWAFSKSGTGTVTTPRRERVHFHSMAFNRHSASAPATCPEATENSLESMSQKEKEKMGLEKEIWHTGEGLKEAEEQVAREEKTREEFANLKQVREISREEKLKQSALYAQKIADLVPSSPAAPRATHTSTPSNAVTVQQRRQQSKLQQVSNSSSSHLLTKTAFEKAAEKGITEAVNKLENPLVANFARNNSLRDHHVQMNLLAEKQRRTAISRGKQTQPATAQQGVPKQEGPNLQDYLDPQEKTRAPRVPFWQLSKANPVPLQCPGAQDRSGAPIPEALAKLMKQQAELRQQEMERRKAEKERASVARKDAKVKNGQEEKAVVSEKEEDASSARSAGIDGEEKIVVDNEEEDGGDTSSVSSSDGSDWEELEAPDSSDDF
ncbi:hypothetical protein BDZ45DRAFT_724373 [Acephala macrosclerotiorum]|nr:hypothetical protein BDZ45DRAFT_724373 [Acephala macrosclerotiorum]